MIEASIDFHKHLVITRDMRITVQLDPNVAREFARHGRREIQCPELADLLESLSINLVPLHPGTEDDALRSYFAIEVPDSETAANVVKQLRPCRGIRAAYVKPAEALPR
jgi:hypothetical protein